MTSRPINPMQPYFNCGPTAKVPGWSPAHLNSPLLSRSHRTQLSLNRIMLLFEKVRKLTHLPENFFIAMTPGSATGAVEMLLWNLLGSRPIDCLVHDVFSQRWYDDIVNRLALSSVNLIKAQPGYLPNTNQVNFDHDVILNWNGSTTGVTYPHSAFIPNRRDGLVIADVTSAIFCQSIDWHKIDAAAFSWQKGLGGEASHGMIFINERTINRLNSYTPPWPIPYLFSLYKQNQTSVNFDLFSGHTLNTPSVLCIEDFHYALSWALDQGGQSFLNARTKMNRTIVEQWIDQQNWCDFMALSPTTRSYSTHCFVINEAWFQRLDTSSQWKFIRQVTAFLEHEQMVYDCANHGLSQPSFRLWGGPTVDTRDLKAALDCLTYAYNVLRQKHLNPNS